MIGGIDLGGTKIEARAFDAALSEVARHRIATPSTSYEALLEGIASQVAWLESQGTMEAIGLGSPGEVDPATGVMLTANLPATGQRLAADLAAKVGRDIPLLNDCLAFTLTEASMGAGKPYKNVVGFVIGTGVAGGQAIDAQIASEVNSEFGHLPLPADLVARHKLPLLACGCGLTGCFETYVSGPGLVRLAQQMTGVKATPAEILDEFPAVRAVWIKLVAALVALIIRTCDPDVIVLGGGLGMIADLDKDIRAALRGLLLPRTAMPTIVQAHHGDASGALGAALFAQRQTQAMAR